MAVRAMGENQVILEMTKAITAAMVDYFSPEQRMDPSMCSAFAEAIVEDYPHESIGDVTVFIKYAGRAKYGKENEDGSITDKGKTYGRLQLTTLIEWWKQYLGEKAETIATLQVKKIKEVNSGPPCDTVVEMMKKAREEGEGSKEVIQVGMRVNRLLRTVRNMSDDQLREAWTKFPSDRERSVVLREANKRGLVQKRIEDHLNTIEKP